MANKGRAQFAKRQKELARQERAKLKAARKIERKEAKARGEILDDDDLELIAQDDAAEGAAEEGDAEGEGDGDGGTDGVSKSEH